MHCSSSYFEKLHVSTRQSDSQQAYISCEFVVHGNDSWSCLMTAEHNGTEQTIFVKGILVLRNLMSERNVTSSCGKVQASPSTSIPSVARSRRSEALASITKASGLSWFLISSAISFTIRWLTLHIF
jgi:hypothetical protein